jgi:hypothetical protein
MGATVGAMGDESAEKASGESRKSARARESANERGGVGNKCGGKSGTHAGGSKKFATIETLAGPPERCAVMARRRLVPR